MPCNPCTFQDFAIAARKIVHPAYMGANLPWTPALNITYNINVTNDFMNFIYWQWNPFNNWGGAPAGCIVFTNRVAGWNADIVALTSPPNFPPYDQYTINRKLAKIAWAQYMWVCCGCPGPIPAKLADPSGQTMAEHDKLYPRVISNFNFDLSDLKAASETRNFTISGTNKAEFILEIKNEDNYYYNFITNTFTATKANLEQVIVGGKYTGSIIFPTVTDDDQYDIYLYAKSGTKHAGYTEVRFGDGTVDINSSKGSKSLMMQKVVYQYTDLTLTISPYATAFTITPQVTDTLTISRNRSKGKIPFTISCTSASTESFAIIKQPTSDDVLSFVIPTVGSAPEDLPGENIYPTVSDTDTVDGAVTSGVKVVMDNNVADNLVLSDRITTAVTTDTVDGAVTSGVKVVMDSNVATKMAVGDQVTGSLSGVSYAQLDASRITVAALDPDGDNAKEFSLSEAVALGDGATLTFNSKLNYKGAATPVTVAALNPDEDNVKEFSMSSAVAIRDGATLNFSNQMNYQWPLDNIDKISEEMIVVPGTNVTANTSVAKYEDTITIFENTEKEEIIIKNEAPATNTKAQIPTVVKGLVTVQPGNVVFDKQQVLVLAGDTLKVGGYGTDQILNVYGYEVKFSDLAVELTSITTTTTSAVSNSTSVPVAERNGILNTVSTVSGIGIDPVAAVPKVNSGANATGAGTIVLSAAQTLESGVTLTFPGAGKVATITGYIEVIKAGTANQTLRFDVEKLLTSA